MTARPPADGDRASAVLRATFLAVGAVAEAKREAGAHACCACSLCRARLRRSLALSRAACSRLRDELPALLRTGRGAGAGQARRCCSRNSLRASRGEGRLDLPLAPLPKTAVLHGHCHQKSFGAIGAVESVLQVHPAARGEDRSNRAAAAWPAASATRPRPSTSRCKMARAVAAAGGAQGAGGCADRGRRHLLPAPDPRRQRARGHACRKRAGDERGGGTLIKAALRKLNLPICAIRLTWAQDLHNRANNKHGASLMKAVASREEETHHENRKQHVQARRGGTSCF